MNAPLSGIRHLPQRLARSEQLFLVLLAMGVGVAGGLGAVFFRWLIQQAHRLFFDGGGWALGFAGDAYVIILPAIGLLLVSAMVRRWAPEAQGHGVPEVMFAVRKCGGRIRPRVAVIKSIASALCIGSGGSVGREGPIVQIGCSVGSSLGQLLGLREERVKLLVACGAAAAIGGTFNAPIAGVLFALEVILASFTARSFGLVVISSVTATAICRAVIGNDAAFTLTHIFTLNSYSELGIYLVLGAVAGLASIAYIRSLYAMEHLFEAWRWPAWAKALLGGLGVGLIGYLGMRSLGGPYLFGVGYDGIEAALHLTHEAELSWGKGTTATLSVLVLLAVLKILSTSLTLAAGGSGGVFAPGLFVGAMLGGAFGVVANVLFPEITAPAGAYALVGMGAVFAGSAHAPITAVLILFEMTGDYKIILPIMMAVVISHLVSSSLFADSIYSVKLRRVGGLNPTHDDASTLDFLLVADAMASICHTVSEHTPVAELAAELYGGQHRAHAVLDSQDKLVGIVTHGDVETAIIAGTADELRAADIMTRKLITCAPRERLRDVLTSITDLDVGQILVVDPVRPQHLLGVLRRREILWAYGEMASEHRRLLEKTGLALPDDTGDSVQLKLEVEACHLQLCFKKIRDIAVPEQCLIAILRRAGRAVIPRGETVVEPGDTLIMLTVRDREQSLRDWIRHVGQCGD